MDDGAARTAVSPADPAHSERGCCRTTGCCCRAPHRPAPPGRTPEDSIHYPGRYAPAPVLARSPLIAALTNRLGASRRRAAASIAAASGAPGQPLNGNFHHRIEVAIHGHGVVGGQLAVIAVGVGVGAQGVMGGLPVARLAGDVVQAHQPGGYGGVFGQGFLADAQVAGAIGGVLNIVKAAPRAVLEPRQQDAGGRLGSRPVAIIPGNDGIIPVQRSQQKIGPVAQPVAAVAITVAVAKAVVIAAAITIIPGGRSQAGGCRSGRIKGMRQAAGCGGGNPGCPAVWRQFRPVRRAPVSRRRRTAGRRPAR